MLDMKKLCMTLVKSVVVGGFVAASLTSSAGVANAAPTPNWDAIDHTAFFFFYRDQLREWVFYTDRRTFHDRYQLAADRGIAGFCAWALGQEDPEIWSVLLDRQTGH